MHKLHKNAVRTGILLVHKIFVHVHIYTEKINIVLIEHSIFANILLG